MSNPHADRHFAPSETFDVSGHRASDYDPQRYAERRSEKGTVRNAHRPSARNGRASVRVANRQSVYTPYGEGTIAIRFHQFLRKGGRIAIAVFAIALAAAIFFAWRATLPIDISVNGATVQLGGGRTLDEAFAAGGSPAQAGDLYDVEGQLLQEGGGKRFAAVVNGEETDDGSRELKAGDAVTFADGADTEEDITSSERAPISPNVVEEGVGTIHAITQQGEAGESITKTGAISGKTVTQTEKEPVDRMYRKYYPDTGGDKVIALTFDDGPWDKTTAAILDVLKEHDAKATFFTVGERVSGEGVELVKREVAEGHQVCTHTWDHANGSGQGVNLSFMSPEEQRQEIEKGIQANSDAIGAESSHVFRAPGGNFPIEVWTNVEDLVSAEIGWDIDTTDWKRPGAPAIAEQIKSAGPGSIVLMHDGGGDRTQTVEALKIALPYLKEQGYRFVTIDEMLQYPPKEA